MSAAIPHIVVVIGLKSRALHGHHKAWLQVYHLPLLIAGLVGGYVAISPVGFITPLLLLILPYITIITLICLYSRLLHIYAAITLTFHWRRLFPLAAAIRSIVTVMPSLLYP